MTCNGQAPFVTIFMYLDEVPEGRTRDDLALIIEEVMKQRMQGVKNERGAWITPAFCAASYISHASSAVIASGFSQKTFFPALIASRTIGLCKKFGVATTTAVVLSSSNKSW